MDSQELQRLKNKYDIVGNDPGLNRAIETAVAVAPTDLTVLITGESGVGKENIPQIIHQHSRRRTGRYLAVNCGAIPEGTINAELFGHEKGAFTGAIGERKGYFEEADGGTLFLDEIGELPKETQALLLRVLQNGEYIKVGSSKVEKTDVRVIAATNVNLAYAVATGKFREDLYYRLTGIQILMPALRDREKDDIYLLFRKFSTDFAEKYGLCKVSLTHEAITALTSYRWPGNIRQLKNVAQTVTALESKPLTSGPERVEIGPETLLSYIPRESGALVTSGPESSGSMSDDDRQRIISAIYVLKQEVDRLRGIVESLQKQPPKAEAPRLIEAWREDRQQPDEAAPEGVEPGLEGEVLPHRGESAPAERRAGAGDERDEEQRNLGFAKFCEAFHAAEGDEAPYRERRDDGGGRRGEREDAAQQRDARQELRAYRDERAERGGGRRREGYAAPAAPAAVAPAEVVGYRRDARPAQRHGEAQAEEQAAYASAEREPPRRHAVAVRHLYRADGRSAADE